MIAIAWLALPSLLLGCQASEGQGEARGTITVNGEERAVNTEILAATWDSGSEAWPDGWLALEIPGEAFDSTAVGPPLGPVCIWIAGSALPAEGGPLTLRSPFANVPPPFSRERWYCLPPEEGAEVFIGVPCAVGAEEILPTSPLPATPTPDITPTPAMTPTPDTDVPPPAPGEGTIPHLRAVVGSLSLNGGISKACDTVELTLEGVLFQRQDCGGGVQNLRFDSLTIQGTLLGVGRDWSTGGAASCL